MRSSAVLSLLLATAAAASNAVPALWDGSCYYPAPDPGFNVTSYLGRWYQVAGTIAPYNRDCKCTFAQYGLNDDGSIAVNNTCQAGTRAVNIVGAASLAAPQYGATGVFRVQFPNERPPDCPGPNYIVQDYTGEFSLVQSNNFSTLFILSRDQHPDEKVLDGWIARAGLLGSDLSNVVKTDQSECLYT
ncbi:Calycin-like protein [Triangularia verruculosa]|uniref:Calycin-like protein n=1 Tax=Triangularia verruculosa TaxID=2587418 RepID=A0AAN7AR45_9PEZI|nr:Calycin-like protein [Triangularia verruculosa]